LRKGSWQLAQEMFVLEGALAIMLPQILYSFFLMEWIIDLFAL
jgi:hypothetical protein